MENSPKKSSGIRAGRHVNPGGSMAKLALESILAGHEGCESGKEHARPRAGR